MSFSPKAQLPWHRAQTASSPCIVFHHAEHHKIARGTATLRIATLTAHTPTHLALTYKPPKSTALRNKTDNRMLPAISLDNRTRARHSLKPSHKLRAKNGDGLSLQIRNHNGITLPAKGKH